MCDIEFGIRGLPDNTKDVIRHDCVVIRRKARPLKNNINKEVFEALKSLNKNQDIVVLKAHKGGATVILNRVDYEKKMSDHLENSGSYRKLDKNPLKRIYRMLALTIKSCSFVSSLAINLSRIAPLLPGSMHF